MENFRAEKKLKVYGWYRIRIFGFAAIIIIFP